MWNEVGLCLVAWLVIYMTHLTMKWRNPKCNNGVLPPGSMGLPFIGESLGLIIPSYSLDLHPFIKKRLQRYGSIFQTSVAGRSVVMSAGPEINSFLIQQEGKSVELWYMDANSLITWDEYKSMTFTLQVINEALRLANVAPGLLRRTTKDISVKGFTIPKGWTVLMVTPALHFDPNVFSDPLKFNPWRWKDIDSQTASKNFKPFGGGMRQCSGSEYTRVFMSVIFHHLVTKYSWTTIKGPQIVRNPVLGFDDGIQVKFSKKKI